MKAAANEITYNKSVNRDAQKAALFGRPLLPTLGIMNLSSWLRREYSFPQWMSPPQWLRKTARFLWAFLSCAFGIGAAAVAIPSPFGGILLVLAGGIALASTSRKVWLDLFVLEGRGAQLFAGCWFIAGLILCIKHYF